MLRLLIASALVAVCLSAAIPNSELDHYWTVYKDQHGKAYREDEEMYRRVLWEKNLQRIHQHNMEADLGMHRYTLGLNQFADMTNQEFRESFLGLRLSANRTSKASHFLSLSHVELPKEVDWRKEGYVTDVKNQLQCGSCWAFSATGSLEGQRFKKTKKLVSLSEQNLIDCSRDYGNMGCNGGLMDQAFEYIKANKGIDTEESYPYEAKDGECRFKRETVGATVTGYTDIPQGDEKALKQAVATIGPISVAIDASHTSFQLYKSGVYDEEECSSTQLDHGVLAVGYGTYEGTKYWLVKNSWGTEWGMDGYIMMSRDNENQCGIATSASYPLV